MSRTCKLNVDFRSKAVIILISHYHAIARTLISLREQLKEEENRTLTPCSVTSSVNIDTSLSNQDNEIVSRYHY